MTKSNDYIFNNNWIIFNSKNLYIHIYDIIKPNIISIFLINILSYKL